MFALLGTLTYFAFVICFIICLVLLAVGAFLIVGGLFGLLFGGSTSIALFGATIPLGVLGATAVKLGIIIFFVALFFGFLAFVLWLIWSKLIPWLQGVFMAAGLPSGLVAPGGGGGAWPFPFPNLPPLPGLPTGWGPWDILFMPDDLRLKLPPNTLALLDCFRGCLCEVICGHGAVDGDHGGAPNPGKVVVDAAEQLLADLKAQLEVARQKLKEAKDSFDLQAGAYWGAKVEDLVKKIAALGG